MTAINSTGGKCPSCGADVLKEYSSPIRTCKKCGQQYHDKRFKELAISGIPEKNLSYKQSLIMAALGVICVLVFGIPTYFSITRSGYYYTGVVAMLITGFIMLIMSIIDAVTIKTGIKKKGYEKKLALSEERLSNRAYAQQLADLGYNVPDKYL